MPKKKDYNQEKNPLQMILYTVITLVLLVFLVVLIIQNKKKQEAFEEKVMELAAVETEMMVSEHNQEEENETDTSMTDNGNLTMQNGQMMSTEVEEMQSETIDVTMAEANILVLNGSERAGIAGDWKAYLEEEGFTGIYTATYSEGMEQTLIYTDDTALGEALKTEFANAVVHPGKIESGIEMTEGEMLPETIDAYVIVGKNNVVVP